MITFANNTFCSRTMSSEIVASKEKGNFSFNKELRMDSFLVNKSSYHNLKIFFDNKEIKNDAQNPSEYYLYIIDEYLSKKVEVKIWNDDVEIYSAKWKIKDTTYPDSEKILFSLFLMSSALTMIIAGLSMFEKVKIKWLIISVLINWIVYIPAIPCFF